MRKTLRWRGALLAGLAFCAVFAFGAAARPAAVEVCVMKTDLGTMVFEFFEADAPKTVAQFKALVRKGFYDGKDFYRVVRGHVIQAGGGDAPKLPPEFNARPHVVGTLGLGRTGDEWSGDSEIYVCVAPRPHLDGKYTVFGLLIEGFDVLEHIAAVPVEERWEGPDKKMAMHRPLKPVVIQSARIETRDKEEALTAGASSAAESGKEGCTVIGVGRLASADGSVMTSHTDCCSECRIQVVPGRTYPKGSLADVHWGMVYFGNDDDRRALPLGDFGKVIGRIPQVERTFTYFHTGYSQMNEKQLAIGESTCSQRAELDVAFVEGVTRQIMTIEQAQVFALERCSTAREAVRLVADLVEKYGFLPSCGGSEALCIADPRELWTMEICSVGPGWAPESGRPGAIWAARRVPDDHVIVIANYFRIRELDPKEPDVMVSPNYMREAVERGWYDPKSGRPFVWKEVYAPPVREGNLSRMWLITSTVAPSLKAWPKRTLNDAAGPGTLYAQPFEGAAFYPFSVKPEKKLSVQDVIAFQRSAFENTIYDMTWDPAWMVPAGGGKMVKSPMATPFLPPDMEKVLRIRHHRTIATQGYGMVAQLRSWLPDAVGGIYWFYVDNPFVSAYVPVYAGATDVSPLYKTYDYAEFSEDSARWAVDFVEKLMLLRWQPAVKDLREARDPLENGFFSEQAAVDGRALELAKKDPAQAVKYLTELTISRMEKVVTLFRELRKKLLTKYSGDIV